jgi:hypothetical protein
MHTIHICQKVLDIILIFTCQLTLRTLYFTVQIKSAACDAVIRHRECA